MTVLLERAISRMRELPDDEQDSVAEVLLSAFDDAAAPPPLSAASRQALREGLAQAERGEFASDREIAALWGRHGL